MQGGGEPHGRRTERPSPGFLLTEILFPGEESGDGGRRMETDLLNSFACLSSPRPVSGWSPSDSVAGETAR